MSPFACSDCGQPMARRMRVCPHCGAPNPARRGVIEATLTVAALAAALAGAAYVASRWDKPLIEGTTLADPPAGESREDFTWLTAAMKACDHDATANPDALHLLVIPLVADSGQAEALLRMSLNDIGNATVLAADDTLNGLRQQTLHILPNSYIFSIRDEATQVVYKWDAATGVKQFTTSDAGAIRSFRMQLRVGEQASESAWGSPFVRQAGNCYWVNAVPSR